MAEARVVDIYGHEALDAEKFLSLVSRLGGGEWDEIEAVLKGIQV